MNTETSLQLRPLRPDDLEKVVEIDGRITGHTRRQFFEKRLEAVLADNKGFVTMALEDSHGAPVGYAIARILDGEFGTTQKIALLDVIGIDPGYHNSGYGTKLLNGLTEYLKNHDIHEIDTEVDWSDHEIMQFFKSTGFEPAPVLVLERNLTN